ncbi:hypothetical protein [Dokdonella sp.]|uniref:hypothetical protein n=1 Tax=Dokdonella sp. TaxID=2291710 RepID=UPI003C5BF14E
MRKHLHKIALFLLLLALLLDLAIWGAVPDLPEIGGHMVRSAHAEAMLASTYIALGGPLDALVGSLHGFGTHLMTTATAPLVEQIVEQPNLAMDLTLAGAGNGSLEWIRTLYWAPPILLVVFLILWATKPKVVNLIRKR